MSSEEIIQWLLIFVPLAIGFGLGFIISEFPSIIDVFKYIGVLFLFYLAFRFFKQSTLQTEAIKPLGYMPVEH